VFWVDSPKLQFKELNFDFVPSPSGPGLCLYQEEGVAESYLVMHGYTPDLDSQGRERAVAIVTVKDVLQSLFGYPNEEAYWKDPLGDLGHGFFEVHGSTWIGNINEYNERTFGSPAFISSSNETRHFFVGSKDVSAQFLARDLVVEIWPGKTTQEARVEAFRKLDEYRRKRVERLRAGT